MSRTRVIATRRASWRACWRATNTAAEIDRLPRGLTPRWPPAPSKSTGAGLSARRRHCTASVSCRRLRSWSCDGIPFAQRSRDTEVNSTSVVGDNGNSDPLVKQSVVAAESLLEGDIHPVDQPSAHSEADPRTRAALCAVGTLLAKMHRNTPGVPQTIAELEERGLRAWQYLSKSTNAAARSIKLTKGTKVSRVRIPCIVDQKIWRSGTRYLTGDAVTHNRSLFIAQVDEPKGRPEDASGCWRLAVCRGVDGRNGKDAPAPKEDEP